MKKKVAVSLQLVAQGYCKNEEGIDEGHDCPSCECLDKWADIFKKYDGKEIQILVREVK